MRVVVTGSRGWTDWREIHRVLSQLPIGSTLIHGGCQGADLLANYAAHLLGFEVICVKANWAKHGKAAGPIRNREMLDMKPDRVIAFRLNMSRGTTDCIRAAEDRGIPVDVYDWAKERVEALSDE